MRPISLFALYLAWLAYLAGQLSAAPDRQPCPRAIKINTNHQYRGALHFICLQATGSLPRLELIHYQSGQVLASEPVHELGANQMVSFTDDDGFLRILLANSDRFNGTSVYSAAPDGRLSAAKHTINSQFVSALAVWRLELNLEFQLAVANQPTYEQHLAGQVHADAPPGPMVKLYSWRSTYFDSYQLIYLPHDGFIHKLEPMTINGQELLVAAVESKQVGDRAESLIYKLDYGDGSLNWLLYQSLPTELAFDVKSFAISHRGSMHRDYYIALLGQHNTAAQQDDVFYLNNNNTSWSQSNADQSEYGLTIYKYLGDRFVASHFVGAPEATKLDALTYGNGDSYVVIALLSGLSNQISLYQFDGLVLKPLAGPEQPAPGPARGAPPRFTPFATQAPERPRRTLHSDTDFHLFLADVAETPSGSTLDKRTLADEPDAPPLLVISNSSVSNNLDSADTADLAAQDQLVYQVPVKSGQLAELADQSHVKREFIDPQQPLPGGENLLAWCKSTIESLLVDNFEMTSKQLLTLPRIDQKLPIELDGDLIVESDLHVSNLLLASRVEQLQGQQRAAVQSEPADDFLQTFEQLQLAHQDIDRVHSQVDQILVDDGSTQDIFNPLTFDTLIVECPPTSTQGVSMCPHVDELRTNQLNERDVSNIQTQALLTGRSMVIGGNVRFEHLVLRGDVAIEGTLNGIPIGDIVFKRGPPQGPIMGTKTFVNGLFSTNHLLIDTWNTLRVDRNTHLTSTGEQRVEAALRFQRLVLGSSVNNLIQNVSSRIETLNGLHLDSHFAQLASADGDAYTFELPVHFDELVLNGPVRLAAHSRLASVDLEDLWLNAMLKHKHQNVTAPMNFVGDVHVSYGGDMQVAGPINGLDFRPNALLMRNHDADLPNPVVFEGDVSVRDLQVSMAINGVQVVFNNFSRRNELAIMYKSGTQLLTGDKILDYAHLAGSSVITGNINGHLDLGQLHSLAMMSDDKLFRFTNIRLNGQNMRFDDKVSMHVDSTINGFKADDICMLANRIAQAPQSKYNRLRFEQPVHFKSLRCASINGFNNLTNVFLTKHGYQHVAGTLRLANGVLFNTTLNVASTLNNLNVYPLAPAIVQSVNESLSGTKEVRGDFVIDDLIADRINNLQLSQVFLTKADQPQLIKAPMTFNHLDIENVLVVGQNMVTNSFNGLNITAIIQSTLQYDAPQVIYNHIELNTLQLLPNSNLLTKSLNGRDLRHVYNDAVLVDYPQQVLAPKEFLAPVEFNDRLSLINGIDDLTQDELRFNLLLQTDELIDDDLEFNNDVIIKKELSIQTGVINDIDIAAFVDSMLYETRDGAMRVVGNGSVQFKDVHLNNLVVGGTIQGVDLSKDAILKSDNTNGSFNAQLRQQQILNNNQRLINSIYGPGSSFQVATNYQGLRHLGTCFVHTCTRTTLTPAPVTPTPSIYLRPTPPPATHRQQKLNPILIPNWAPQWVPKWNVIDQTKMTPPPPSRLQGRPWSLPPQAVQQQVLPVLPHQNSPQHYQSQPMSPQAPIITTARMSGPSTNYSNSQVVLYEYKALMQAQAIRELSSRINKHLSISFYYEIAQKHPLLGPVLHATLNPTQEEPGVPLLFLKGVSRPGEPCLKRDQTVAVMTLSRQRKKAPLFSQSSLIQETSDPLRVQSLQVGSSQHYLFILDSSLQSVLQSQVLVYIWNYSLGMYELRERIPLDGHPTAMKAFTINNLACIALANPRLIHANHTSAVGSPMVRCQDAPGSDLKRQFWLAISHVFELDIISLPMSSERVLVAALSQKGSEQIGDLSVHLLRLSSMPTLARIGLRRMVRPLKLHLFADPSRAMTPVQLAVSEGITSNDDTQASTRIFALQLAVGGAFGGARVGVDYSARLYESQVFRDNQFYDIQSVSLGPRRAPLLFFQSAHSVSIYAASSGQPDCYDANYQLIHRLPTKGANRFLVFNDGRASTSTSASAVPSVRSAEAHEQAGHYLVLSKDDCEQQNHATLILRARFD